MIDLVSWEALYVEHGLVLSSRCPEGDVKFVISLGIHMSSKAR